jgi:cardiolipin synthase
MFVAEYLAELRSRGYTLPALVSYVRKAGARAKQSAYKNPHGVRSVVTNAMGFFVLFFLLGLVIAVWVNGPLARRFLLYQSAWLFGGTLWLLLHVGLLRGRGGAALGRIGLANQLSFLRLALIPSIYLFIVEGYMAYAFVAYALAGLSDILDGMLARRLGLESRLGLVLDPLVDVGYILGIFTALYEVGWVPPWLFAVVCLRYAILLLGATVVYFVRGRLKIQPTGFGKASGIVITGVNYLLLTLGLFGALERSGDVHAVLTIGLGFLFAAACVQLIVIGLYNLRDGDAKAAELSKVVGEVGPRRGRT